MTGPASKTILTVLAIMLLASSVTSAQQFSNNYWVTGNYLTVLGRSPDTAGWNFWTAQLNQGMPQTELTNIFLSSAEYCGFFGVGGTCSNPPTDEQFLTRLYQEALGRLPDTNGYQYWLGELATNLSRAQVVADFLGSSEFQAVNASSLAASALSTQVPQEDFKCATGVISANPPGGPTTIACQDANGNPQPLSFPVGSHLMMWGATGSWKPLNTQTMQYMTMVTWAGGTTMYVSDTGEMEATPGSLWQVYPETLAAACNSTEVVTLESVVDSRTITLSPTSRAHCPSDAFWGPLNRPNTWAITIVDSTHFSVPLDSSSFGPFTGHLHINRASAYAGNPCPYLISIPGDGNTVSLEVQDNNQEVFTIDGCPTTTNAVRCSFGYSNPFNGKSYGDRTTTSSLVVSGGIGTFTLNAFRTNTTTFTRTFAPGQLFWLWNFSDNRVNRPWVAATVTGTCAVSCVVRVTDMGTGSGGASVPDGTYPVTGNDLAGNSFYFGIYGDYYVYWGPGLATILDYPTEYSAHMAEGTYSSSWNRFRAWYCWGSSMTALPLEFGSYPTSEPSMVADHGYHTIVMDTYGSPGACQWQLYEINNEPVHWVNLSFIPIPQGPDPTYTGWIGAGWTGEHNHYFDIDRTFYLNLSSIYGIPGAQTSYVGPMYYDTVAGEPEEWVISKAASYNPGAGKFHLNIVDAGGKLGPCANTTMSFVYSRSELKALGWSNATSDGSTSAVSYGANGIWQVNHDTAAIAYGAMYFGIRPQMCISGVSGSGANIQLSFRQDPNMQVGDHVTVSGVGGNTSANQTSVAIAAVQPRQYFFRSNQGYSVPVTLTGVVVTGSNTCTANFTVNPNVFIGQEIGYTGMPAGINSTAPVQGISWATVTAVGTNSFSWKCAGSTNGTYNTDYGAGIPMAILTDPAITLSGTGSGNWDGNYTGILISTENFKNFSEISFSPPGVLQ